MFFVGLFVENIIMKTFSRNSFFCFLWQTSTLPQEDCFGLALSGIILKILLASKFFESNRFLGNYLHSVKYFFVYGVQNARVCVCLACFFVCQSFLRIDRTEQKNSLSLSLSNVPSNPFVFSIF